MYLCIPVILFTNLYMKWFVQCWYIPGYIYKGLYLIIYKAHVSLNCFIHVVSAVLCGQVWANTTGLWSNCPSPRQCFAGVWSVTHCVYSVMCQGYLLLYYTSYIDMLTRLPLSSLILISIHWSVTETFSYKNCRVARYNSPCMPLEDFTPLSYKFLRK